MPQTRAHRLTVMTTFCLALSAAPTAQAQDYLFSQGGYSGGGILSGGFSATDTDNDGSLNTFFDDFTAFSLNFSGDSLVPDFSMGLPDLAGLIYVLSGGDAIGDEGAAGAGEGLVAFTGDLATTGILYGSGLGPTGLPGGQITDFSRNSTTSTNAPITVSPVPEPQTWALLLAGLGLTTLALRRRRR